MQKAVTSRAKYYKKLFVPIVSSTKAVFHSVQWQLLKNLEAAGAKHKDSLIKGEPSSQCVITITKAFWLIVLQVGINLRQRKTNCADIQQFLSCQLNCRNI